MSQYGYTDKFLDVTGPMGQVEIEVKEDGEVIWVHTDGRSVLRVCRITDRVIINDHRPEIVNVHYELEYRFDDSQPWTAESSQIEWTNPDDAERWAAQWRPDRERRIVEVKRTPIEMS